MTWLIANLTQVGQLLGAHLLVTLPAIILSILIAVPIGRLAYASRRGRAVVLASTGILYAIPSLPLLILIPLVFGFALRSPATMIVALTVYGVALLSRSAADAFDSVPRDVIEAATATGLGRSHRFWSIELPLALPVLVAGTRVVAMSTIGLATIGALIGIPSLGSLLTDGFQRGIAAEVTTGIVLTLVLAVVIDTLLRVAGRIAQPWAPVARAAGAVS